MLRKHIVKVPPGHPVPPTGEMDIAATATVQVTSEDPTHPIVQIKAAVLRDGGPKDIPVEEIVPGDIVILNAGALVPGDCLVQESTDLFVDEAMLTGETFPVEKAVAVLSAETPLGQRTNALWMGTHIVSGSAKALVLRTGKDTEFGKVSERLRLRPQETDFEHGIRQFGYFLMEVTLVLVVAIFAISAW